MVSTDVVEENKSFKSRTLKRTGILAAVGAVLAFSVQTVINSDPGDLQRWSCYLTSGYAWSCDKTELKLGTSNETTGVPAKGGAIEGGPVAGPSEAVAAATPTSPPTSPPPLARPEIALDGTIYPETHGYVYLQVRAKFSNNTPAPLLIAWGDLKRDALVTIDGGRSFKPHTQGNSSPPATITYCRGSSQNCWERSRADFSALQPGDTVTGTLTFSTTVASHELDGVLSAKTYSFTSPVIFGGPEDATSTTFTLNREGEPLKRRR